MGQAKQRKAEIMALKASGIKMTSIFGFGAYYKDDADDGVSIMINTMNEPAPGFTKTIYKSIEKCVDAELNEIANGNLSVKQVWAQLYEAIDEFNIIQFGKGVVRPTKTNYEINVKESLRPIIAIMTNIWLLTERGEITNDKYNGMEFAYQSK